MASINTVTLLGRLTRDAEVRKTGADGTSYCRVTVACDRYSKNKEGEADFISVVAWRQSADYLGNYGRKGNLIAVTGSIKTGSYKNKDGATVYTTDVLADRVQLINDGKKQADYSNNGNPLRKDDIKADDGFDLDGSESCDTWEPPF